MCLLLLEMSQRNLTATGVAFVGGVDARTTALRRRVAGAEHMTPVERVQYLGNAKLLH